MVSVHFSITDVMNQASNCISCKILKYMLNQVLWDCACLTAAGAGLPLLIGTLSDVFWFLRDDGTWADLHRSEVQTLTLHTHSLTLAPVGPLHQVTVTWTDQDRVVYSSCALTNSTQPDNSGSVGEAVKLWLDVQQFTNNLKYFKYSQYTQPV